MVRMITSLVGMSAALEAVALHPIAHIVILEKEKHLGGNSAKASSGINAAHSIEDIPTFLNDTIRSGGDLTDHHLASLLAHEV